MWFQMNSYVPWAWNCSTACVPRSWISSDVLSRAPLKRTCCVCESGPAHTWHSERTPCSGWDSQVRCPRLMARRSPVKTVPVKERIQTMTYKELNLLWTNGIGEWWRSRKFRHLFTMKLNLKWLKIHNQFLPDSYMRCIVECCPLCKRY